MSAQAPVHRSRAIREPRVLHANTFSLAMGKMKNFLHLQHDKRTNETISDRLAGIVGDRTLSCFHASAAYVTVAGVRTLIDKLHLTGTRSEWLIGLDDALTQPGAIQLCQSLAPSKVRTIRLENHGRRFHPKVMFAEFALEETGLLLVGSSNITRKGLEVNVEAVSMLEADSTKDYASIEALWNALWRLGQEPTQEFLEDYKRRYELAQQSRKGGNDDDKQDERSVTSPRVHVLESDDVEMDPSLASVCWVECGKNPAQGREIELVSDQLPFFGLSRGGGDNLANTFLVSDGSRVNLEWKYRSDNGMWRLGMSNDVPEVSIGLRPKLKGGGWRRSPWVAVFSVFDGEPDYQLGFVGDNSQEYLELQRTSRRVGAVGNTGKRKYGWH